MHKELSLITGPVSLPREAGFPYARKPCGFRGRVDFVLCGWGLLDWFH